MPMATPLQTGRIVVLVVSAVPGVQFHKTVLVPLGQSAAWALAASGLLALHPALKDAPLGIWGQKIAPANVLQAGDRLEVYAPVMPAAVARVRQLKRAHQAAHSST
jgi:uncharacterized protein